MTGRSAFAAGAVGLYLSRIRLDIFPILGVGERSSMAHEREIAEEQEFLDVALSALDHMRTRRALAARQRGCRQHARRGRPRRARRRDGHRAAPPRPARHRRPAAVLRSHRLPGNDDGRRRRLVPRWAPRRVRRGAQPAGHRLARAGRRSLLPRDGRRAARSLATSPRGDSRQRSDRRRGRVLRRRQR